jgi:RHS repeat-associated protein
LGPLSYTYGTTNNQLLTYNSNIVSTDAMGNITSKNGLTLTYDDWGRMRTSNNGSNSYTYGVNGLDERVEKSSGSTTYYYIYAGVGQLLGIYNNAGQAVDEMVYLGDKPIASVRSGVVYNIETDNLNTPVRVLDQSNNIDWSWEGKEPFGLSQPTQAIVNGSSFIFNLRFPGQYADQETGLFQNGYRDYDPTTGRYMEVDPLGLNAGWNPYNYVESNSLNNVDLLGLYLYPWEKPIQIIGGTLEQQQLIKIALNRLFTTEKGQEILQTIKGTFFEHGIPQFIYVNNNANNHGELHKHFYGDYGTMDLDPNPNDAPCFNSYNNAYKASLARMMGHEFGHSALGDSDDGFGNMNNIVDNENIVAKELNEPLRTSYNFHKNNH